MTNRANTVPAGSSNPLSDEFVNAVIHRHGYGSTDAVIARLYQWMGRHGGENSTTLLIYEAHKALSKLRAPVADERTPLTRQDIFDRFQFLEGLVNEQRYKQIAETAIAIYESGAPWASMADTIRDLRAELGYVTQYGKRVLPDMCPPATSRDRWMYEQGRLAELAALASAPVADERAVMIPLELANRINDALGRFVSDEGWGQADMDTADDLGAFLSALASAPVAGEAIAGYMVGTGYFRPDVLAAARIYAENRGLTVRTLHYADAAPQASEAVRNAALDEAAQAAYLALFPKNQRSDWTEYAKDSAEHAEIVVRAIRALKTQADKDGGDCAKGAGDKREPSPTAGMNLGQRIAHVGGRTNAQGYIEFGSPMAVNALIQQVLRDLPDRQQRAGDADEYEKMRDVLQWIVDDAASGGVAKLRPQQEKRARAALSAQPAKEPANPKPSAAGNPGAAGVSDSSKTGAAQDGDRHA